MNEDRRGSEIAIVGGGVVGCALAYDLSRAGARVTVFERGELGNEASGASAGIISPPAPRFGSLTELSILAYRRYPTLIAEIERQSGISTFWNLTGEIVLGLEGDENALEELGKWQREHDVVSNLLPQDELRQREPGVADHFTCGLLTPHVASVLLDRVTVALARSAEHTGARIYEQTAVHGIETSGGRATGLRTDSGSYSLDLLVIAAGAWSRVFSDDLDFSIPTVPVRGQMMAVRDLERPVNSILAHDGVYIVPRLDGTVAIGATEEPDAEFDSTVTPAGLRWLTDRMERLVPGLVNGRIASTWAGLRPGTEDGLPLIGRIPHIENSWVCTGHFRSGALLAPATSELLSASILSGEVDPRLNDFNPARVV
ncbi:MAG: glycine oxidase ThiO [Chloroflexota bacterium]